MLKKLESLGGTALLAGVFCYFLAGSIIVGAPWLLTDGAEHAAAGEDGKTYRVYPYAAAEQAGRDVYGNQVCWHCHSQFIRPVNDEDKRWGPVSRAGESSWDIPHFFSTRRVGPDLAREGGLRIPDWQMAHLWNPRATVSRSVMPGFTWLFDENPQADRIRQIIARLDTNGDGVVAKQTGTDDTSNPTREIENLRKEASSSLLDTSGVLADVPLGTPADAPAGDPKAWKAFPVGDGLLSDYDARPLPTERAKNLVLYLQCLGGKAFSWRKPIFVTAPPRTSPFQDAETGESLEAPRRSPVMRCYGFLRDDPAKVKAAEDAAATWKADTAAWAKKNPGLDQRLKRGKELFDVNCASCHGLEGRGNGEAAQFFLIRPRDFTSGQYRYRSTVVGNLPLDGDIYRSIARGLPGTAMPSWNILPETQIWLLVDYVKTFYEKDMPFNDRSTAVQIPPQKFDSNPEKERLRGRAVYLAVQCFNCHGKEGEGDGTAWRNAQTPMGNLVRPRDFRPRPPEAVEIPAGEKDVAPGNRDVPALRFRGGAAPEDIYRTIMTGLDGTGMKGSDVDFLRKKTVEKAGRPDIKKRERFVYELDIGKVLPLSYVTGDQDLASVGVKVRKAKDEATGKEVDQEYIELQADDDWALVHYVMWLAEIPIPKPGG